MGKKIAFHSLGCKVNAYETEYVVQRFLKNGYEAVTFDQKADIYIINTCTVTNIADRKSRQMISRARKLNKAAIVAAMGCYVETDREGVLANENIDIIIGNNDKGRAYEIITDFIDSRSEAISSSEASANNTENPDNSDNCLLLKNKQIPADISTVTQYDDFKLESTTEHTRVYIKIEDGCNQFCSYCAIPLARGRVRSRKIESIVDEITDLAGKGYKEFVLTGINLSSYAYDHIIDANNQSVPNNTQSEIITGNTATIYNTNKNYLNDNEKNNLIDVIKRVSEIDGVKRIRLGSLEPRVITDDFIKALANTSNFCPHFHLSLQSGSDSVLKRMNRHYTTGEFYEKVELIRNFFDKPAITTDVIAGFPGETIEEFNETRSFLNKCNFYEAHIFKYSRRRGTAADKMKGQLTEKEKAARSDLLLTDAMTRSLSFRKYYVGKSVSILLEEAVELNNICYLTGFTPEYVRIIIKSNDTSLLNTIQQCKVTSVYDPEHLLAEI